MCIFIIYKGFCEHSYQGTSSNVTYFFIEPRNWTNRQADIVVTLIDLTYMSQPVLRSIDNRKVFFFYFTLKKTYLYGEEYITEMMEGETLKMLTSFHLPSSLS